MNKKGVILGLVAVVVLAGLFVISKPKKVAEIVPQEKVFEFVVQDKKITTGPSEMKVVEGEQVKIKVTVDEDTELHLHGYDLEKELQKNIPAELQFVANMTGRFPLELHQSDLELGNLEVVPK